MIDQCCFELDIPTADICPKEGSHYHVIFYFGVRLVVHLCDEHSAEVTEAENR